MVGDLTGATGCGKSAWALAFLEKNKFSRPWAILETGTKEVLYVPAFSAELRRRIATELVLWVHCREKPAPAVTRLLLESSLFEGVLLNGFENFPRAHLASVWGRRWQLAAAKGGTHLIWLHEKPQSLVGFDLRLEWSAPGTFEIKKGHAFMEENSPSYFSKTSAAKSSA